MVEEDSIFPTSREISRLAKFSYERKRRMLIDLAEEKLSGDKYNGLSTRDKFSLILSREAEIKNKVNVYCTVYGLALVIGSLFILSGFWLFVVIGIFAAGLGVIAFFPGLRFSNFPEWELKDLYFKELKRLNHLMVAEESDLKERKLREISEKLVEVKKKILVDNSDINSLFKNYASLVEGEMQLLSPGCEYLAEQNLLAERRSDQNIKAGGSGLPGYTPVKDPEWQSFFKVLVRERGQIQDLASKVKLPFAAINFYQDISRSYFGLQREGGSSTIYDEQVITNEVLALKENLVVQGNYMDNRVQVDRSVSNTTNVSKAIIDTGEYSRERIKKEIIKAALVAPDETVSRIELMSKLPVNESELTVVLDQLQLSGQIVILNRQDGEVAYKVDRLA